MYCRIALLLSVAIALPVFADAPFEDISYPAALKKAKDNDKIVMIDFYTTWCGPCKMLDRHTWPDEDVRKWLDKHAVCMKVDAEASKEFARRFKVRAYPTIVFIKADGSVLDSIVGFRTPRDFIEAAKGALSGKDALTRAREAFEEGDENDPMHRSRYADRLVQLGKYEEALEHYLWCFDEGELHRPAYSGVRVSFLLGDIKKLADVYPPALEALKTRRDRSEEMVRDYIAGKEIKPREAKRKGLGGIYDRIIVSGTPVYIEAASDAAALNDTLNDNARTIQLYDELKNCDRNDCGRMRHWIFDRIDKDILNARRYEDYVNDGDPVQNMKFSVEMLTREKAGASRLDPKTIEMMNEHARANLIKAGGMNYEACVGADRDDLAKRVKSIFLEQDDTYLAYDALVTGAMRARRYDLLQSLADEARAKLGDAEARRISRSVKEALATPEAMAALKQLAAEKSSSPKPKTESDAP